MKNIYTTLILVVNLAIIDTSLAEELTTELAYGLVSTEFDTATRTDPTLQVNFGKRIGPTTEVKIGYMQLGNYSLIKQSEGENLSSSVQLQAATLTLVKSLGLTTNWSVEYGLGIIRWQEATTFKSGKQITREENDLQVNATVFYQLEKDTQFGFRYTETDTALANIRTVTCNLKYNVDL